MTTQITTLPNGLRVATDHIAGVETAALGIWVGVGSRHESLHLHGASHFLEHMAFKGTHTRSAVQIAEEIEAVGGHINAYTSLEHTAYYARTLAEDVPLALNIIADILQNSTFQTEEFERERTVILQEIQQTLESPEELLFDLFQGTAFPDHPLGRPILGTKESLQSFTPSSIKDYMVKNYSIDRMVLVASGKVNHTEIVSLASTLFKSLPLTGASLPQTGQGYQGGRHLESNELEQVHLALGFQGLDYSHPHYFTQSVLAMILGGGMSSRLFQEVREKRGLAYTIQAFASAYKDNGLFGIYAGTAEQDAPLALEVVQKEVRKVATTLSETEIKRAKAQIKASLMMGQESTSARCEQLARHLLNHGRSIPASEILAKIDRVSVKCLQEVAELVFNSPQTLTGLGPINGLL